MSNGDFFANYDDSRRSMLCVSRLLGARKMTEDGDPYFVWQQLIGLLLIFLPWLSLIWPPLFGLWLVLIFVFLFLIPALGRMQDAAEGRR